MPKGDIKTTLLKGSTIEMSWRLSMPHRGGFEFELLDSYGKKIRDLSPKITDEATQSHSVTLPSDVTCTDCIIRIVQHALEFGDRYKLRSCADVDIVESNAFSEKCCGNGEFRREVCNCNSRFHGPKCEFENECEADTDCGHQGKCLEVKGTNYPKKQCFCRKGDLGLRCQKSSSITRPEDINTKDFSSRQLKDDITLYWRILSSSQEIEVLMEGRTMSYMALGWRSPSTGKECRKFPAQYFDWNDVHAEPEPEGEPEGEPEPEAESEPEPGAESEPRPYKSSKGTKNEYKQDTEAEPEPESEPEGEPESSSAPFHPMDCTDMVIGTVINDCYKICDYYSRDRSTPRMDLFWGGTGDLTAALGWENRGNTTIYFKKKLQATHPTDQSIEDSLMHVIWSYGQKPDAAIQNGFYFNDELKYHGTGNQRGNIYMNFFDQQESINPRSGMSGSRERENEDICGDSWKSPRSCSPGNCDYYAKWEVLDNFQDVRFTVETNKPNLWIAVGFSENTLMPDTDIIYGWMDDTGKGLVFDGWIDGYNPPREDGSQDISEQSLTLQDGILRLSFVRKLVTNDRENDVSLGDNCIFLVFPTEGGGFSTLYKRLSKHQRTPSFSSSRVCIKPCTEGSRQSGIVFSTTPKPSELYFNVEIQLDNFGQAPSSSSSQYLPVTEDIRNNLEHVVSSLPGYKDIAVESLTDVGSSDVRAKLILILDKHLYETKTGGTTTGSKTLGSNDFVYRVLEGDLKKGKIGSLVVNREFLSIKQMDTLQFGG